MNMVHTCNPRHKKRNVSLGYIVNPVTRQVSVGRGAGMTKSVQTSFRFTCLHSDVQLQKHGFLLL